MGLGPLVSASERSSDIVFFSLPYCPRKIDPRYVHEIQLSELFSQIPDP